MGGKIGKAEMAAEVSEKAYRGVRLWKAVN